MATSEKTATLTMSVTALDVVCRALADRGEDYGWNVYVKGWHISAAERRAMIRDDDNAAAWLEAWDAATASFRIQTGGSWTY